MSHESFYRPVLLVVCGPSGAGKSTLVKHLRDRVPELGFSVSYTTRARRGDEVDGVNYHYVDVETFERMIAENAFLEYANVYGNYYGTAWSAVREALDGGTDLLLEIDVQGAELIRQSVSEMPEDSLIRRGYADVFISPPDLAQLRTRLEGRAEDAPDVIERRMQNAEKEMAEAHKYDFMVVNADLDTAIDYLAAVYRACKLRVHAS